MKKTIVSLCVIAAMAAACHKTKPMEPTNAAGAANTTGTTPAMLTAGGPKAHLLHMSTGSSNYGWCGGFPANCVGFDDIIVNAKMRTDMNNAASSGSAATVAALFSSSDFATMDSDYLGTEATDKLTSGNYYLARVNDDGSKATWIAGSTYPVTMSNMDFGFQAGYTH